MKRIHISHIVRVAAVFAVLVWTVPSAQAGFWSKLGKVIVHFGDDVAKHADDVAKHADDLAKHADDVAKHGDDAAKGALTHTDDAAKAASENADDLAKAAGRGADDAVEAGARAAEGAAAKGGKTVGTGTILATGVAVGLGAVGVGEGVGLAKEGEGKGKAHQTSAEKNPEQYAESAYGPWRTLADWVGKGAFSLLTALGVLIAVLAVKIARDLLPARKRAKAGGQEAKADAKAEGGET